MIETITSEFCGGLLIFCDSEKVDFVNEMLKYARLVNLSDDEISAFLTHTLGKKVSVGIVRSE